MLVTQMPSQLNIPETEPMLVNQPKALLEDSETAM